MEQNFSKEGLTQSYTSFPTWEEMERFLTKLGLPSAEIARQKQSVRKYYPSVFKEGEAINVRPKSLSNLGTSQAEANLGTQNLRESNNAGHPVSATPAGDKQEA